jgi:hypothetical protein
MKREYISSFGGDMRDRSDRSEHSAGGSHIFLWTVFILLLTGFCLATWIGTFTVFGHPERPFSYKILRKIKKLDSPQRYKLNAAPQGEFLTAEKAYARYAAMSDFDMRTLNVQLTRDYIRNFQQTTATVPYLTGRFSVMQSFALQSRDLFPTGAAALAVSLDNPQFLVEQIYPADAETGALIANSLVPGVELELKRTYDLSAVTRVTRLPDGRILVTVVPLTYGSFTLKTSEVSFSLEPPTELNLAAGWPVLRGERLDGADKSFLQYRRKAKLGPLLARAKDAAPPAEAAKAPDLLVSTESSRKGPSAPRAVAPPKKAAAPGSPADATKAPAAAKASTPVATPAAASTASAPAAVTNPAPNLPPGRRLKAAELGTLGEQQFGKDERVYLTGQFFVQAVAEDRAVLILPGTKPGPKTTRVIATFPAVKSVPNVGTELARDDSRPFQVTDIRRTTDGSLTVFVKELPR